MKQERKTNIKNRNGLEVFVPEHKSGIRLPLFTNAISAGFPSPADDFIDKRLDINEYVVKNPNATFYVKVHGQSMINAGIYDGDILVVDRSLEPQSNRIVIGVVNGEFTVKRIIRKSGKLYLKPENEQFKPIEITEEMDFKIWGVVTFTLHKLI